MADEEIKKPVRLGDQNVMTELNSAIDDTRSSIALMDVLSLLKSKNATVHHIATAISFDPGISETLIREVNSPHFGLPHRVKDVPHAISLLGFQRTQEVIISNTKHDMYKNVENSYFEFISFKKHCMAVGCFAEQIAVHLKLRETKEFFKAGTLHDIGKYFYLTKAAAQFEELIKASRKEGVPFFEIERRHLKTDHAEIGAIMGHQWELPEPFCAAIRYHHELPEKVEERLTSREAQMVKVVSYANLLSHGQKDGGSSTGHRVSVKDLPPPPGILTDEDLGRIISLAENQYREECENSGLTL